jgi:hypothetical protein
VLGKERGESGGPVNHIVSSSSTIRGAAFPLRKPDSGVYTLETSGPEPRLSYHVQFESLLSLTGTKADRRFCIAPPEMGAVRLVDYILWSG